MPLQTKYKQAKTEANSAQNKLQKEITDLRDECRGMHLKLRDIEVASDTFEQQARNTTSSLEDMEQKYNQTIERGVMLEEEMRAGEQEREQLRIESQRLREELSDLKVESEIMNEKLRAAEGHAPRRLKRVSQLSDGKEHRIDSPASEASFATSLISASTPPVAKSEVGSEATTPPSPPLSDLSLNQKNVHEGQPKRHSLSNGVHPDPNTTPRPSNFAAPKSTHRRGQSTQVANGALPSFSRSHIARPRASGMGGDLPRSESLYQIRGLIGKMQNLEKRVQSARSKLPAPTNTPPRASPRGGASTPIGPSALSSSIPASVTMRNGRKRTSITTSATPSHDGRGSQMSYAERYAARPESRTQSRTESRSESRQQDGRPGSRLSNAGGFARPASRASGIPEPNRPPSAADRYRPRSSLAGSYDQAAGSRRQSQGGHDDPRTVEFVTPTIRRTTGGTAIPTPGAMARRQSASTLKAANTPARRKAAEAEAAAPDKAVNEELGETW